MLDKAKQLYDLQKKALRWDEDGMDVDGVAPWLDCLHVSVTVTPLATGCLPVMLATVQARLNN